MPKKARVSSFFTSEEVDRFTLLANTVNDHSDVLERVSGTLDRVAAWEPRFS